LGSRRHTGGRCAGAGRYTRRTDEPRLRPHLGTRPSGCRALGPDLARRVLRLSRLAGGHHRVAHNHSNDNSRSGVGIDVRVTAGPVGYRPKKQQMRWSPLGAHLLLQVRTRVLNNQLADDFHRWYPEFTHRRPPVSGRAATLAAGLPGLVWAQYLGAGHQLPIADGAWCAAVVAGAGAARWLLRGQDAKSRCSAPSFDNHPPAQATAGRT